MTHLRQGYGGQASRSLASRLLLAIALAAFGVVRGTWAVGGSDSSCYALMAQGIRAAGSCSRRSALAIDAPWPNAAITFAPGGFIPSPIHPDAAAPICAPGMSVLMAPLAALFGQDAIFWLTPIAAAVLVLSAFVIARQLAGGMAGATAAILTATSPIVLYPDRAADERHPDGRAMAGGARRWRPLHDVATLAGCSDRPRDSRPAQPCAAGDRAGGDAVHPARHADQLRVAGADGRGHRCRACSRCCG